MDSYSTYADLIAAHPTGNVGDAYLAGGELYVWGGDPASWKNMGSLIGPTGPTGAAGATILDSYATYADLIAAHPTGNVGDTYLAGGVLYVWGGDPASWQNMGSLIGPTGPTGAAGATILDSYATYGDLIAAHPTGNVGDAYLAGGELYVWGGDPASWQNMGSLIGPEGPQGPAGPQGLQGEPGLQGELGPTGPQGIQGVAGTVGTIRGAYDTEAELRLAHPIGVMGEMYLVGDDLFVWDDVNNDWINIGNIAGPQGIQGEQGLQGADGAQGDRGPTEIQFSSLGTPRFQTGVTGTRAGVIMIGLGYEEISSVLDPVSVNQPAISIKTLTGGIVTDIAVALSIALGSADATGATIFAQLYTAQPFNAKEFFPLPNTQLSFTIPIYAPISSAFSASLSGLSANIEPGTQLYIGFYATSTAVTWGINAHLSGVVKMEEA